MAGRKGMTNGDIMLKIKRIQMFTDESPTQWFASSEDNLPVYIRYRHGWLSIQVGKLGEDWLDAADTYPTVMEELVGGENDGVMATEVMFAKTSGYLDWSEVEIIE
jgi:hypothetical protein